MDATPEMGIMPGWAEPREARACPWLSQLPHPTANTDSLFEATLSLVGHLGVQD